MELVYNHEHVEEDTMDAGEPPEPALLLLMVAYLNDLLDMEVV